MKSETQCTPANEECMIILICSQRPTHDLALRSCLHYWYCSRKVTNNIFLLWTISTQQQFLPQPISSHPIISATKKLHPHHYRSYARRFPLCHTAKAALLSKRKVRSGCISERECRTQARKRTWNPSARRYTVDNKITSNSNLSLIQLCRRSSRRSRNIRRSSRVNPSQIFLNPTWRIQKPAILYSKMEFCYSIFGRSYAIRIFWIP